MRHRRSVLTLVGLAVFAAGPAGCSSGDGAASPSASASSAGNRGGSDVQQMLAIGRRFAQCGRDHGFPTFPDPEIVNGKLGFPNQSPDQKDQDERVFAIPECRAIYQESTEIAIRLAPTFSPAEIQKLRDFAKCIREHGIPEWPDPKSDGSFPLQGTPLHNEPKSSDRLRTATDACKQHWDKGIRVS